MENLRQHALESRACPKCAKIFAWGAYETAKKKREEQEEKIDNLDDCEISEERDENTVFMLKSFMVGNQK